MNYVLHPPVDRDRIAARLARLFGIRDVTDVSLVHGGYMSQNLRVDTPDGSYFLKQYRNRISTVVHEIKYAERFFHSKGLPVIVPVSDAFDRAAFWMDGNWFSLFPFVDGRSPLFGEVTSEMAYALGAMLGKFHEAGRQFEHWHFQTLRLWDREKFWLEYVELEEELRAREASGPLSPLETRVRDVLARKSELVRKNTLLPHHVPLAYDCLLHGDFIYQNVFMDAASAVTHVFDLEKTCVGPRGYELARAMVITCFDDAWQGHNFALARKYLAGYRSEQRISYEEFFRGVRMYMANVCHMTWIEAKFLLYGTGEHLSLYERHARRIEHIGSDADGFCEQIYT